MKQNKLRIGIISHNYPASSKDRKDAGIFIHDFAHELSKNADVFVFCPDFGGKKEKYKKVPVTWFDWGGGTEKFGNWKLYNPVYLIKFLKLMILGQTKAIEFAKKNKLDYCLACWAIPSSIFAFRIKNKLKIPYAAWSLGSDVNKYSRIFILNKLISISLNNANVLFANSFALCEKVEKLVSKKCYFLPAITNFNKRSKTNSKSKRDKFTFLFVGRLEKVKGPDILIDAIKKLSKNNKNFTVNILGDGTMKKELKNLSKDYKNFVNFHGWADENKVSFFMQNSDCLIIPSRSESLPLVMIEAAKRNLAIIATDVGDCKRVIDKYKIGATVDIVEPGNLSKIMQKMLKGEIYIQEKGFETLAKDFSQSKASLMFLSKIKNL